MKDTETLKLRKGFLKQPFKHTRKMVVETHFVGGSKTGDEVCEICGLTSWQINEDEKKGKTNEWCQ